MKKIKVCLVMHSTRSDNLGVGALTVSEIAILRSIAKELGRELEITVIDFKDARAPYVSGDDIVIRDFDRKMITDPRQFFAIARRSDAVIDIGAGDSFADIYGSGRLNRMFAFKFLTHLSRTPLIVAPQTIGPFTKTTTKLLARLSLKLSKVVATRDSLSTQAAKELGATAPIEASDLALRLPYDRREKFDQVVPQVGINVSGLLMAGGYSGKNDFEIKMDYPVVIRRIISSFQSRGAVVHLVPHVIVKSGRMQGEDDSRACAQLAKEFPGSILAPDFASPSEAKTYISRLDFFTGARMHACIAAFSSGVPVVPMAYSRKFEGLFGTIGYHRTLDCTSAETEQSINVILSAFEQRHLLADEAAIALETGKAKIAIYEDALKKVLNRD